MKVSIFHAGGAFFYLYGLVNGIIKNDDIQIDVIGSKESFDGFKGLNKVKVFKFVLPLKNRSNLLYRIYRLANPYVKSVIYSFRTDTEIFHIQWHYRFKIIDMIFLINLYKLLGKKVIYTAHNVNTLARNNKDSTLNRTTLKYYYKRVDHIIVHNNKSKQDLIECFSVKDNKISVIKMGINNFTPNEIIDKNLALKKLNLPKNKKIILFFGAINTYKGLENLITAFKNITNMLDDLYLVIAGASRDENYFALIKQSVNNNIPADKFSTFFRYIDENEIKYFFNAADCVVLPYKAISQSAVHVLSYSFGIPVIATDVGSFKEEDVIENITGMVCKANDINDLERVIMEYFNSSMYQKLESTKSIIKQWAQENYNWDSIGKRTIDLYKRILNEK